jgi:hypothetical protein
MIRVAANQGGTTLAAILKAIDGATAANGDVFATVASSLKTIIDSTRDAIGSLIPDGLASGADISILDDAADTVTLAQLCASA